MSEVFIGQIMLTGFPYAPHGFALCNGQTLGIGQNQALFALLGVQFGGDGVTNFRLPDLQGRTPVGAGSSTGGGWSPTPYSMGAKGGQGDVTLDQTSMPSHSHLINATSAPGTIGLPSQPSMYGTATLAAGGTESIYADASSGTPTPLMATTVTTVGGGQPHPNMQPFQVVNFNIALTGIFPSRT